jgi:hypothetical protein
MNLCNVLGYVGPGPGLTMGWALLALLGTVALSILYLLIWPVRMLLRRGKGNPQPPNESVQTDTTTKQTDTSTAPR